MALPPEHLHIKRRREEEPVETLYIQPDSVQHSKRRFTDFVFQRVVRDKHETVVAGSTTPADDDRRQQPQLQPPAQAQRAVSVGGGPPAVPRVRATAPGEEFEEVRRQRRRLMDQGGTGKLAGDATGKVAGSSSNPAAAVAGMRRFHLASGQADGEDLSSSPAASDHASKLLRKVGGGGVQKKKMAGKLASRAVVVEKMPAAAAGKSSGPATKTKGLDDLTSMIGSVRVSGGDGKLADSTAAATTDVHGLKAGTVTASPRKRHVINEAEKRWRAEDKTSKILHDRDMGGKEKTGQSAADDPKTWNQESEQLADELAKIAMEMTGDAPPPPTKGIPEAASIAPTEQLPGDVPVSKPALKYQPRLPKHSRARRSSQGGKIGGMRYGGGSDGADDDAMKVDIEQPTKTELPSNLAAPPSATGVVEADEDSDSGYVYDEFIRRPVQEIRAGEWVGPGELPPRDVGVVVITNEDAHYWDALAEDDEERDWNTDDEDSNAEDNPANEYPDEDLAFDDELNDANTAYRLYRHNASDDEEFDMDEYDEYGYPTYNVGGDSDDENMY